MAYHKLILMGMVIVGFVFLSNGACAAKVCRYDYHTYKVGESFITKDCQGKCICQVDGSIACVSLCPPFHIDCPAGQVKRYRQVPAGSGCSCRRPYCVPVKVCRIDDRTYKVGESFITKDCYARCKCQARGNVACVSLCPPVHIRCLPGHVVKYRKIAQGNSCFCRHPYCAKRVIYTPY